MIPNAPPQCQMDAATDSDLNPKDRWETLGASDAWKNAINHWQTVDHGKTTKTFMSSIVKYLGGPIGMACGVMAGENGCHSFLQDCSSAGSPAGYLILNSLIAINSVRFEPRSMSAIEQC